MKFRIHFKYKNGTKDSFIISGDSIENIQMKTKKKLTKRGIDDKNAWSELIENGVCVQAFHNNHGDY